jgi:hypothetical protein
MRKNNNTIEINGKRYNTRTGALLTSAAAHKPARKSSTPKQPVSRASKPAIHDIIRHPSKQSASHAPQPSRILMRQAVKKPGPSLKRRHKAQGHADAPTPQTLSKVIVKPSISRLDEQRLRHARQIPHSRLISRFPPLTNSVPPAHSPAKRETPVAQAPHSHQAPKRPTTKKTTADLLDRAVEQATSHLQPPEPSPRKARRDRFKRTVGIGGAIGLSVLVLGVIVSQNLSNVRLQMASSKAGFNVSLPDYRPAGYALGQLNYSPGVAAAQFHSNSDGRQYTITQKSSSWDSPALRDNFITPSYAQYRTVSAGGRIIYIYGNHNATWVNGGVWYVIQSDGSLSDQQLVDLAMSL